MADLLDGQEYRVASSRKGTFSDELGCTDGNCPFSSRHGMHTNGGCSCLYDAFPDMATRRLVDAMLRKAREVADSDASIRMVRKFEEIARGERIAELRAELGRETDKEVIARRRELRAEIERLELEGMR